MSDLNRVIKKIGEWLETDITPYVNVKKPKKPETERYDYELIHPAVYLGSTPPQNLLPSCNIAPSVTVKLLSSKMNNGTGSAKVQLELAVWNPGTHKKDWVKVSGGHLRHGDGGNIDTENVVDDIDNPDFQFSMDGYHDVVCFAETIVSSLEEKDAACGFRKTSEISMEFPFEKEPFTGTYPNFYMTLAFDITFEAVRLHKEIEDFLK